MDMFRLVLICSSVMDSLATATPRQRTFLSWNFMEDKPSSILVLMSSFVWMTVGNLPHLVNKGPPSLGSCFSKVSEMKKSLYLLAHFLSSFPFLSAGSIFFFKASASMWSTPAAWHLSTWLASAITQT